MLCSRKNRVRVGGLIYCHDECDPSRAPGKRRRVQRRQVKRSERQQWKREVDSF